MSGPQMSSAANLYQSVINDVITSVRESFLDESVDENVLLELKNLWVQVTPQRRPFIFLNCSLIVCRNLKPRKLRSLLMHRMHQHLIPRWLGGKQALAREGGQPHPSNSWSYQIPIGEPKIRIEVNINVISGKAKFPFSNIYCVQACPSSNHHPRTTRQPSVPAQGSHCTGCLDVHCSPMIHRK